MRERQSREPNPGVKAPRSVLNMSSLPFNTSSMHRFSSSEVKSAGHKIHHFKADVPVALGRSALSIGTLSAVQRPSLCHPYPDLSLPVATPPPNQLPLPATALPSASTVCPLRQLLEMGS